MPRRNGYTPAYDASSDPNGIDPIEDEEDALDEDEEDEIDDMLDDEEFDEEED